MLGGRLKTHVSLLQDTMHNANSGYVFFATKLGTRIQGMLIDYLATFTEQPLNTCRESNKHHDFARLSIYPHPKFDNVIE